MKTAAVQGLLGILHGMKKKNTGDNQKVGRLTYETRRGHEVTLTVWRAIATVVAQEKQMSREELLARIPKGASNATVKALIENGIIIEEAGVLRLSPQGEDFCHLTHERRLTRSLSVTRRMLH